MDRLSKTKSIIKEIRDLTKTRTLYVQLYRNLVLKTDIRWIEAMAVSVINSYVFESRRKGITIKAFQAQLAALNARIQKVCKQSDELLVSERGRSSRATKNGFFQDLLDIAHSGEPL